MITEREIFLTNPDEKAAVIEFLNGFGLTFTGNIDYTMGLFEDGKLIGTGSLGGRVMRDIAISKDYQKKGLTRRIIRNLQENHTAAELREIRFSQNLPMYRSLSIWDSNALLSLNHMQRFLNMARIHWRITWGGYAPSLAPAKARTAALLS